MRYIYQGVARDGQGAIIADATISVYGSGGVVPSTIYTTETIVTSVNSVQSSSTGSFLFWVDNSEYSSTSRFKISISKFNYARTTYDNIALIPYNETAGLGRWLQTTGTFTATPASTSTITMEEDLTGTILVGYPLKYVYDTGGGAVIYYGIVTAITADLLTIAGAPLDTGHDVTALYYGDPVRITQIFYNNSASVSVVTTGTKCTFRWSKAKSYMVFYQVKMIGHDTHATEAKLTWKINGTEVNTSTGGLAISANNTWYSTVVDIAPAAYDVNFGEDITLVATEGGNVNGYGIVANAILITP
jgi:hypothetical protein